MCSHRRADLRRLGNHHRERSSARRLDLRRSNDSPTSLEYMKSCLGNISSGLFVVVALKLYPTHNAVLPFLLNTEAYNDADMCFSDNDDEEDCRSVRVTEYRSRPLRVPFPPRHRPSCPSPPMVHCPSTSTAIIYPPHHYDCSPHCSPPHSPRASYTVTRRRVRIRRETIYPAGRMTLFSRAHRKCPPESPPLVEYIEPGRRRRAWENGEIEYIPIR